MKRLRSIAILGLIIPCQIYSGAFRPPTPITLDAKNIRAPQLGLDIEKRFGKIPPVIMFEGIKLPDGKTYEPRLIDKDEYRKENIPGALEFAYFYNEKAPSGTVFVIYLPVVTILKSKDISFEKTEDVNNIKTPREFVEFAKTATPQEILGITSNADTSAINKAFRTMSTKFHPDKWPNDAAVATNAQQRIVSARDKLLGKQ